MYKFELPPNCPPAECYERKIELYRLFHPTDLVESFKNHVELYEDRKDYLAQCKAYALSFFDNIETLKELLKKENNEGKKIAKVQLEPGCGKISGKTKKGHYSLWLYKDFDLNKIVYEFIEV